MILKKYIPSYISKHYASLYRQTRGMFIRKEHFVIKVNLRSQ